MNVPHRGHWSKRRFDWKRVAALALKKSKSLLLLECSWSPSGLKPSPRCPRCPMMSHDVPWCCMQSDDHRPRTALGRLGQALWSRLSPGQGQTLPLSRECVAWIKWALGYVGIFHDISIHKPRMSYGYIIYIYIHMYTHTYIYIYTYWLFIATCMVQYVAHDMPWYATHQLLSIIDYQVLRMSSVPCLECVLLEERLQRLRLWEFSKFWGLVCLGFQAVSPPSLVSIEKLDRLQVELSDVSFVHPRMSSKRWASAESNPGSSSFHQSLGWKLWLNIKMKRKEENSTAFAIWLRLISRLIPVLACAGAKVALLGAIIYFMPASSRRVTRLQIADRGIPFHKLVLKNTCVSSKHLQTHLWGNLSKPESQVQWQWWWLWLSLIDARLPASC